MDKYRIKIVSGIFADYTGPLGAGFEFVNGVSVEALPTLAAQAIAAEGDAYVVDEHGELMLQSGSPLRVTPGAMPYPDTVTESFYRPESQGEVIDEGEDRAEVEPSQAAVADELEPESIQSEIYTREQLEAVADKVGLRGLREIGDKIEVRGKSIPELIERILTKTGEA